MKNASWRRLVAFGLASGILLAVTPAVYAFPPNTLAEALNRTAEAGNFRTPILVINPEQVQINWENQKGRDALNALYEKEDAMPPLKEVVFGFDRQLVACSSVQVIAPLNRIVLNPYPGPVEEWARMGRERAARLLFASLTAGQWASASGANGLALSDLSKPEQKAYFRSLIPDPFVVQQFKLVGDNGESNVTDVPQRTIPPEQVHLRVVRAMSWMFKMKQSDSGYYGFGSPAYPGRKPGDLIWGQVSLAGQQTSESYRDRLKDVVRLQEPNRLKRSDLSFNTAPLFGRRISLADVKNVGDLVRRVAEKTGIELYADRRYAALKVTILGQPDATADTADVMKALCYAFAGAIRKVSDEKGDTVYILTSDREGVAAPRLRLAEWANDVDALLGEEQNKFEATSRDGDYIKGVGFGEGQPALNASSMARAEEEITKPDRWSSGYSGYVRVPVEELSPEVQQSIAKNIAQHAQYNSTPLDEKNIYANFSVNVQLVVPGYGSFSGPGLTSLDNMLKKQPALPSQKKPDIPKGVITLPPMLAKFAVLRIAPKSEADIDKAVAWAKQHGFAALFVKISLWDSADQKLLDHAVSAGTASGIKVYPALSLLKAPPLEEAKVKVAPNNLPRTVNVLGETLRQYAYRRKDAPSTRQQNGYYASLLAPLQDADWLDAGSEEVRKAVAVRVQAVAATPGIAGVIFTDAAAPGLDLTEDSYADSQTAGRWGGYRNLLRVAMIRQENVDPIDLVPSESMPPYISIPQEGLIPYFPLDWNFRQVFQQGSAYHHDATSGGWSAVPATTDNSAYHNDVSGWNLLRRKKNLDWIGDLHKDASLPAELPLLWEAPSDSSGLTPWTQPWKSADLLPPTKRTEEALIPLTIRATSTPDSVRFGLSTQLNQRITGLKITPYAGIVIDITGLDMDKSLSLLNCLSKVN